MSLKLDRRMTGRAVRPRLHRTIWYMGAKSRVIPDFLDAVLAEELRPGDTVFDLMCGSGVVSAFAADRYRVLANDVQGYASEIARSLVVHDPVSKEPFLGSLDFDRDLRDAYDRNFRALARVYRPALKLEDDLLQRFADDGPQKSWAAEYRSFLSQPGGLYPIAGEGQRESVFDDAARFLRERAIRRRRENPAQRPAVLATAYYANVYFGLRQAMKLDSLRSAIDSLAPGDPFHKEKRCHYLSALLHAASVTTSGTSHFAQPRHFAKTSELCAMAKRRLLDTVEVFKGYSEEIAETVRRTRHRPGNRVLNCDYRQLINQQGQFQLPLRPQLVYLDPPYTADHYSRFYHVLEVLARYDYPDLARDARGDVLRGRYPRIDGRFQSGFCRLSGVEHEFRRVLRAASGVGAKLVISYSSPTGLLLKKYSRDVSRVSPVERLEALCREHYTHVRTLRRPMLHSGQGDSNRRIEELLVVCR